MKAEIKTGPVSLTDKNHAVVLEALCSTPGATLSDTCKPFEVLEPGMTEGTSGEHFPLTGTDGLHVIVKVGEIFHPMGEDHSIGWVCLITKAGCTMRVRLNSDCGPVAHLTLGQGDSPVTAYAYCNFHSLQKTNI